MSITLFPVYVSNYLAHFASQYSASASYLRVLGAAISSTFTSAAKPKFRNHLWSAIFARSCFLVTKNLTIPTLGHQGSSFYLFSKVLEPLELASF